MEMTRQGWKQLARSMTIMVIILLWLANSHAQQVPSYSIKNGRMYIFVPKTITIGALDSFVTHFDLVDLDLRNFFKTNNPDSLGKLGWKIEVQNEKGVVITKGFEPFEGIKSPANKMIFQNRGRPLFPAVNNGLRYGVNRFKNKWPFTTTDSVVRFFLRNHKDARQVRLAGSFNDWVPNQLSMQKTDSGWIYHVKLGPGKYWYKFIVDGHWITDPDNQVAENDGFGNTNSIFFRTNISFSLPGFQSAKKVFVTGSFNNWKPNELAMRKTEPGWELPLYLADGTHTYKFVVDGRWYHDEKNPEKLPDGNGAFNSVIRFGNPVLFKLPGYTNAQQVVLVGSFNGWREDELKMTKTSTGWELPYALGSGNHEYKFKVDGKWVSDPANPLFSAVSGNSYLVVNPNYTFRLKGFENAKEVFLAGNFNNWDPKAYAMKKQGNEWVFPVNLSVGKHLYKFVVDEKWIIDPGNKLWEQNEHGTGNSVLWIEQ